MPPPQKPTPKINRMKIRKIIKPQLPKPAPSAIRNCLPSVITTIYYVETHKKVTGLLHKEKFLIISSFALCGFFFFRMFLDKFNRIGIITYK